MSDALKNMRRRMALTMASLIPWMANSPIYGRERSYGSPTKCKSVDEIAGYHHDGIYSQPKKLRKGAGHKKLTRAQRKKGKFYETKRCL